MGGNAPNYALISLRNTTYELLVKFIGDNIHFDRHEYKDIKGFYKIYQDTSGVYKPIFDQRINFMLEKVPPQLANCFMYKVLQAIKAFHLIQEEKLWGGNIRCFLSNHISLAKFITFKYYFAGCPSDFSIENHINIYENDNFFLNGELFVDEIGNPFTSNNGRNCFNLFGFQSNGIPYYFLYTWILQVVGFEERVSSSKIEEFLLILSVSKDLCSTALDRLVSSAMIVPTHYKESGMTYSITIKGLYVLKMFYNNINYLYYSCLDAKLPESVVKRLNVAANNFTQSEQFRRFYPSSSIISGILFLRYLNQLNMKLIRNRRIMSQIKKLNSGYSSCVRIPIDDEMLRNSINDMVSISFRDRYEYDKLSKYFF